MRDFDATLEVNGENMRVSIEIADSESCKVPRSLWGSDCAEYLNGETVYVLRARAAPPLNSAATIRHDDGWTFQGRVSLIKADIGDIVIHVTDDHWPDFEHASRTAA